MASVGRISGPLLKADLLRNGIDLAFETDLLYLKVDNQRIGIKTTAPQHELDINGTTQTTNLRITNVAELGSIRIEGNTISSAEPYLNLATLDTVVSLNRLEVDSVSIEGNAITTNSSNADLELRPNGTGTVNVHSDLNVDGNIHATGNISADGDITIGSADQNVPNDDIVRFNAEIASDIIPDATRTYSLGSDPSTGGKEWNDVWVNNLVASSINSQDLELDGIDLTLRHGNIWYVAANGDDANSGDHILDPFGSIKYALEYVGVQAGDVIHVSPGVYTEEFPLTIPAGVTVRGEGLRGVTIQPTVGTNTNDAFLLNGETTIEDVTITGFYSPGYAFKFAPNYVATTRSPYIRNTTVITEGSVTDPVTDPRGFDAGDAGKGAYIDGSVADATSVNTAMLFHSATFITPGVDAIVMTNGARVEWLNSFTYFANRSMYAYDSTQGRRNAGKSKITLAGASGAFTPGNTITITSTDSSTVLSGTIASVNGNDVYVSGYLDLFGFDLTPASITDGVETATAITDFDLREFGAEVRSIASASVYGTYGLVGDGPGVIVYAIGHNLAYIGNGKAVTNDPNTVIQANEVVADNGAKIRYNSVDHKGDFRVGDLFYVNQETGNVTFAVSDFTINTENGVSFVTGGDTTFIDGTKIETGDWRISGNTVETLTQDANFAAGSGEIYLNSDVNINGSLDVTGNVTIGGNITIGDEETDTIQIIAGIDSDITPKVDSTYSLGEETKQWSNLYVNEIDLDSIVIRDNFIEVVDSNADLELRANGTGNIYVPNNDVQVDNDLTVSGLTTLADTTIVGAVGITGDYTQTGNYTINGQFSNGDIIIDDNFITTSITNSDLELRASGTGNIYVPSNDVVMDQDLRVYGTTTLADTVINGNTTQVGNTTQTGNINLTGDLSITGNITISDATQFENINIDDNVIKTTISSSNLELRATQYGDIVIPDNDLVISNDLFVTGTISTGDLNTAGTITANRFSTGDIIIDDNYITTTLSNSNLELRANGTGEIVVPSNNTILEQNLTVNGSTYLQDTTVVGSITHTGNVTQIGDINLTGNLDVTGEVIISASVIQFEQIQLTGNAITTTDSNANLELRANGTGSILIPTNDVQIDNNLTVTGTITVGNVTSVSAITADTFSTGDILINDNYITTTQSNSDLELRTAGTGSVIIDDFDINGSTIATSSDIIIAPGSDIVNINATGALKLPVGDTSERPTAAAGQIRFNTDLARFEGYNGTNWVNLKGVEDLDGNTKVTAELTEGANDNVIRFYIDGSQIVDINSTRLAAPKIDVDDISIDGNVITTTNGNKDLNLTANGTGRITFDNFAFKNNTITNTETNAVTVIESTGSGYVKFSGSYGIVIPVGASGERPPIEFSETGQMRYNTDDERVEIWDGTNWVSVAGAASGITRNDAEEIALATVLVLG